MTSQLNPDLENAVSAVLTEIHLGFVTLTLVTYDWIIGLGEEIHCFWSSRNRRRRKLNAAALLYGLTRYSAIVLQILMVQSGFLVSETAYVTYCICIMTIMLASRSLTARCLQLSSE
ncbi:hypothetical protein GSI_14728 [Ganoderma sinense ZZ0214-1]|uniref:DUF6533 domain-containing protein n=1 Tax=Ganoderma sinense ZZ0214-1 TaxID=1077348 RepID=A0A2G8RPI6_9APHY|nr:hypothetical protein GSI_14728 [Ganoderma sinense ZZ0214-1]